MGTLIYVDEYLHTRLPYASEKETLPLVATRLAPLFHPPVSPDESGLYLVSANAGFQSSQLFWAQAQRQGVSTANPELFPWTLANAPAAWLARYYQLTGPNVTYTGKASALLAALQQADDDLRSKRTSTAWIIALDFAQHKRQRTALAALRLSTQPSLRWYVQKPDLTMTAAGRPPLATTALVTILRDLKNMGEASLTDGHSSLYFQRADQPVNTVLTNEFVDTRA